MACNGNNHPPDCTCNFGGGNRQIGRRYKQTTWSPNTVHTFQNGRDAFCPECGKLVFFHNFKDGRGNYFDGCGGRKHHCTNKPPKYSPYNRQGKTKLRCWPTELEEAGWLPFFTQRFEYLVSGVIIIGHVLDNPTVISLGTLEDISFEDGLPTLYRSISAIEGELKWLSPAVEDFVDHRFLKDCPNELELRIKTKSIKE